MVLTWLAAVNGGDVNDVLNLYGHNATLTPTFSPDLVGDREGLNSYFIKLASRPNFHVALHEETFKELQMSARFSVATGLYSFTFDVDGAPKTSEARFTFIINLSSSNPIVYHHSSMLPSPPV